MKKVLVLVVSLFLVLGLVGCSLIGREDIDDTIIGGNEIEYYTQDQVDTLLQEQSKWITEMMYDNYIEYDEDNNILYSNCLIVDGIKQCNIVINLNEDYVTAEEYQELLDRIEVLEGE